MNYETYPFLKIYRIKLRSSCNRTHSNAGKVWETQHYPLHPRLNSQYSTRKSWPFRCSIIAHRTQRGFSVNNRNNMFVYRKIPATFYTSVWTNRRATVIEIISEFYFRFSLQYRWSRWRRLQGNHLIGMLAIDLRFVLNFEFFCDLNKFLN